MCCFALRASASDKRCLQPLSTKASGARDAAPIRFTGASNRRMRQETVMLQQWSWNFPTAIPVAMPIGLKHVDSEVCWCEPIIEVDAEEKIVIHREVTWH